MSVFETLGEGGRLVAALMGRMWGRGAAYVFGFGVALEVRLDGSVLFVELGQVWHEVFDDVGVG